MRDFSMLRDIARLHAFDESRIVRRSPILRQSIHHHALIVVPWFISGDIVGFSVGTLGESPQFFFRSDTSDQLSLVKMCSDASNLFSEYFVRCDDAGIHPQIIVPDEDSRMNLSFLAGMLARLSGDFPSHDLERSRYVGRLLGFPFIHMVGFAAQQSLVVCAQFVDDHFALPVLLPNDADVRLMASLFFGVVQAKNPDASSYFLEALSYLRSSELNGDSGGFERAEHMIKTVIIGELSSRYSAVNSIMSNALVMLTRKGTHLETLQKMESGFFHDYMILVSHHLGRMRRASAHDRESIGPRFFSIFNRTLMKVRRIASFLAAQSEVEQILLEHDPVSRASARLSGRILRGLVDRHASGFIMLSSDFMPLFAHKKRKVRSFDGGVGEITAIEERLSVFKTTIDWSGSIPPVGSTMELIPEVLPRSVSDTLDLVDHRLGRIRGGEPWTHRPDVQLPVSIFHPHRENLISHLSTSFGGEATIMSVPPETEAVLQKMWSGKPLVMVQGPPGSGRTSIALQCAALGSMDGLVLLVAPDSRRAEELSLKLSLMFPRLAVLSEEEHDFPGRGGVLVKSVDDLMIKNLNLPETAAWVILDDADHVSDSNFALISCLSSRFIMTFSSEALRRPSHSSSWSDLFEFEPSAAAAIFSRSWIYPWMLDLSISYRLPMDTIDVLKPAFEHPSLRASTSFPSRSIDLPAFFELHNDVDRALSVASSGVSIVGCELPSSGLRRIDHLGLSVVRDFYVRLVRGGVRMIIGGLEREVCESDILVVVKDGLHVDFFRELIGNANLHVSVAGQAFIEHPIVLVLDDDHDVPNEERARMLAASCCLHQIACFLIHRGISPSRSDFGIAPEACEDVIASSRTFLEIFGSSLALPRRRIRFQDRR